jgi:hypothetical protein
MKLINLALSVWLIAAQSPTRSTDVAIPGLDVHLKAGWRLLIEHNCRFAVPVPWRLSADGTAATAPDGSMLSVTPVHLPNWTAHKAAVQRTLRGVIAIHENSDRRLWIEFVAAAMHEHYIAVTDGSETCVGVLSIRNAASEPETSHVIADSIGPAR